jgi:hypothetical protein
MPLRNSGTPEQPAFRSGFGSAYIGSCKHYREAHLPEHIPTARSHRFGSSRKNDGTFASGTAPVLPVLHNRELLPTTSPYNRRCSPSGRALRVRARQCAGRFRIAPGRADRIHPPAGSTPCKSRYCSRPNGSSTIASTPASRYRCLVAAAASISTPPTQRGHTTDDPTWAWPPSEQMKPANPDCGAFITGSPLLTRVPSQSGARENPNAGYIATSFARNDNDTRLTSSPPIGCGRLHFSWRTTDECAARDTTTGTGSHPQQQSRGVPRLC